MALLMKEIVTADERAEFAGDVQLEWYPSDPRNASLAARYIFTGKAIGKYLPSVDLLDKLRMSFLWEREPNRFVVVATYGHGKSHLALALANFFGKPAESEEVQGFLDKIAHASGDGTVAQNFRDFKKSHSPYLVIRLRGDVAKGLHEQFILGLERALQEHEATKGTKLPFWYEPAEAFLKNLSGDNLASANEFLSSRQLDVPALLDAVEKRDMTKYGLCRQLHKHIYGTLPDFGGEVNLQDALTWATDTFCGEGKPLSGMLILFDEFSAFIQSYAEKHRGGAPLQDLLNGVSNRRSRVVFVAFSQHDPDTAAENAYRQMGHDGSRDDIRKELERLPKSERFSLYSSLETVLDSYLSQDTAAWGQLLDAKGALECIEDATDSTMRLFSERYDERLGWGTERVDEVITKGCFPLHPITTALLCSVQFREVTNPRSVLGFVLSKLKEKSDQAAVTGNMPNWVYPIELVDWFGNMLADREYEQYDYACQKAGPECSQVQTAALKAMLLNSVAQLKPSVMGYVKIVSLLTGYPQDQCRAALEKLHADGYIGRDEAQKTYVFYAVGGGVAEVEGKLREQVQEMRLDWNGLCKANSDWAKTKRLFPIAVECDYGHQEDWAATQVLLTQEFCNSDHLKQVITKFRIGNNGLSDAPRGFVLWLVADNDDDVAWFSANAESLLDNCLGSDPPPVVVAIPSEPLPRLRAQMLRRYALASWSPDVRREFGSEAYFDTEKRIGKEIDDTIERVREATSFVVPQPYRGHVRALGNDRNMRNLKWVLKCCYGAAYPNTPMFYTQYKSGAANLRKAVEVLSTCLVGNSLAKNEHAIHANPVACDLLEKFLKVGSEKKWSLVTVDDRICVPGSGRVTSAWKFLDDTFAPGKGEVPAKTALVQLLNPQFGLDYNQLSLVFCAWYGYNRHYLQMSEGGRFCSIDDVCKYLSKSRDFIDRLCFSLDARISRRDRDEATREITALVDKVNKQEFSHQEAEEAQRKLLQYAKEEENEPNLRKSAEAAADRLNEGLRRADEYDKEAGEIMAIMPAARSVSDLSGLLKRIEKLPTVGCVLVESPDAATLRAGVLKRVGELVEERCRQLESLKELTAFENNKRQLEEIKGVLLGMGQQPLLNRVSTALERLQAARADLEAGQKDADISAKIDAMKSARSLADLRSNRKLLKSFRPQAESTKTMIEEAEKRVDGLIEDNLAFLRELSGRLEGVLSARDSRDLKSQIQMKYQLYAGNPEAEELTKAVERCDQLEGLFRRLEELLADEIGDPKEANAKYLELDSMGKDTALVLADAQRAMVTRCQESIKGRAVKKIEEALQWLANCESEAKAGSVVHKLLSKLENPPAFLPPKSKPRLDELKQSLQARMDQDVVLMITERFRQIADKDKRKECLQALQRILEQES